MKKVKFLGFLSIFSLLIVIPILLLLKLTPNEAQYKTVKISNIDIKTEVADTTAKRIEGLMSKKILPDNEGMLFIFNEENYHGIWMMNTSFPIDIIWIDKDLKIVDIVEDAQPCKFNCPIYRPDSKASYVLEVNSGFTKKNKLQIGDYSSIS